MATQLVAERPRVKSQGIYLRGVGVVWAINGEVSMSQVRSHGEFHTGSIPRGENAHGRDMTPVSAMSC